MSKVAAKREVDLRTEERILSITRPVVSVIAADATLEELGEYLIVHHTSSAAVLTTDGEMLGFASTGDVVREQVHARRLGRHCRTRDIELTPVVTVDARATIAQAAAMMAARSVYQLVVLSKSEVVGTVQARDVLRRLARACGVFVPDDSDERGVQSLRGADDLGQPTDGAH